MKKHKLSRAQIDALTDVEFLTWADSALDEAHFAARDMGRLRRILCDRLADALFPTLAVDSNE